VLYTGITECREIKKLINWPTKGLTECLLWPNCRHPFCCGHRNHRESFEAEAPEQVEEVSGLWPVRDRLSSGKEKLPAVSRQRLKAAVGPVTVRTVLRALLFKLGLTGRQDCQLCRDGR